MPKGTASCLLFAIFLFNIYSCSSDGDCSQVLEPIGNEFTYNCNRYAIELGQLSINRPGPDYEPPTTSCKLQFVNNENGNGFYFEEGLDTNINLVDIWLTIPTESARSDEIPEGTYTLNKNYEGPYREFDIVHSNRVIIGSSIEDNYFVDYKKNLGSIYDDLVVTVAKIDNQYEIEYTMVFEGKTIKGYFKGALSVVDNWA